MQQINSEIQSLNAPFIYEMETFENETVRIHLWTQEEYYQMAELGFFDGKRVELIEGEIIEMSPMNKPHATAVRIVLKLLREIFAEGYLVDNQLPMTFNKLSEPEPEVAIIKGDVRDFTNLHPQTAELIIEVSDTTLRYDRTKKAGLYAKNKIKDYWILNLKDRRLEICRRPVKDKNASYGFSYVDVSVFSKNDEVSPLVKPDAKIKVADILP